MKLSKNLKKLLIVFLSVCAALTLYLFIIYKDLPRTYSLDDYKPPLITFVYDRNNQLIGEFFKERRILTPFEDFPKHLIQAFISAEDGRFFEHKGVNYRAIFRAFLANIKAGKKVQGGSTITQQVARSLLLSRKKTYTRKLQEVILASRMERHLSKENILYLYLNQIYLGHGAYGVGMASRIYFKKEVKDLSLEESALLAGLPQAPSRFSPISNVKKSKARQKYVLFRMVDEGYILEDQAQKSLAEPLKVFMRENYSNKAPYFVETVRQLLTEEIGEEALLTKGLKVITSLDLDAQQLAQEELKKGLEDLDKRQGYRGPLKNISLEEETASFFEEREKKWIQNKKNYRLLTEKGEDGVNTSEFKKLKEGDQIQGVVRKVEKELAYVDLMFENQGVISLETSSWARKPNKKVDHSFSRIDSMASALKKGDVVWVRIQDTEKNSKAVESLPEDILKKYRLLSLEQEPKAEGALLAFDQATQDIIAMVGGYSFLKSQFNRTYQAKRQTGSVFKPIIYVAALDKGYSPNSIIVDEPVVYENEEIDLELKGRQDSPELKEENLMEESKWRPSNYSKYFTGDILFRNGLIKSLNIPTVKLIEKIGIPWIEFYSRRLGIINPLNADYTLALGSSSVTLYEMTKVFSIFGRKGLSVSPRMIQKALTLENQTLISNLSLDNKFKNELEELKEEFKKNWEEYWKSNEEENNIFFKNPNQVISKETAYLITSLLQGVISEGTGKRANIMGRPIAGKTGTTNGYYDSWFIGYSPQIITGVWMGFDNEESLGLSETGARAALPVWYQFMKKAHTPLEVLDFKVPESIVFARIDNETGLLASNQSKEVVNQAFLEGTEPREQKENLTGHEEQSFLREDMAL